ncbi:MAG TPA: UDP-glucose 4-epimerase GalE, partial [Kofleriaceae bacterium]
GYSVREVLDAARAVLGSEVRHSIGPRRTGDPARLVADPTLAANVLHWIPQHSALTTIVEDALRSRRDR